MISSEIQTSTDEVPLATTNAGETQTNVLGEEKKEQDQLQDDLKLLGKQKHRSDNYFVEELKLSLEQGAPTELVQNLLKDSASKVSFEVKADVTGLDLIN